MQDGAMLIIEAKDLAADKISKGHKGSSHKKSDKEEEMIEVSKVKELLENWDDKDHQYYKDVAELVGEETEEEDDDEDLPQMRGSEVYD